MRVGHGLARDPNSCAAALQGRGGSTGYDNAVALPGRSDDEELAKENNKSTKALKGQIVFSVAKVPFTVILQARVATLVVPLLPELAMRHWVLPLGQWW